MKSEVPFTGKIKYSLPELKKLKKQIVLTKEKRLKYWNS